MIQTCLFWQKTKAFTSHMQDTEDIPGELQNAQAHPGMVTLPTPKSPSAYQVSVHHQMHDKQCLRTGNLYLKLPLVENNLSTHPHFTVHAVQPPPCQPGPSKSIRNALWTKNGKTKQDLHTHNLTYT